MSVSVTPNPGLTINLQENKQSVTLSVVNGTSVTIDTKSVTQLIQLLSNLRCQMEPRATGAQSTRPLQMLTDGACELLVDRVAQNPDNIVIGIFHPGPGWVGLALDKQKASGIRDLIEYMAKLVKTH